MAAMSLSAKHRAYVARIAEQIGVPTSYLVVGEDYLHINDYGKRLDSLREAREAKANKAAAKQRKATVATAVEDNLVNDQDLRDAYTEHVALAFEDADFQPLSFAEFAAKMTAPKPAAKQQNRVGRLTGKPIQVVSDDDTPAFGLATTVKRNRKAPKETTEYQPVAHRADYMGRDNVTKNAVIAVDVSDVKMATKALQGARIGFSRGTTFESSKRGSRQKLLVKPTMALRAAKVLQAGGMTPRNFERAV